MRFVADIDSGYIMLLPYLSMAVVKCSNPHCGEIHGFVIVCGWLCFNFGVHFGGDE